MFRLIMLSWISLSSTSDFMPTKREKKCATSLLTEFIFPLFLTEKWMENVRGTNFFKFCITGGPIWNKK